MQSDRGIPGPSSDFRGRVRIEGVGPEGERIQVGVILPEVPEVREPFGEEEGVGSRPPDASTHRSGGKRPTKGP